MKGAAMKTRFLICLWVCLFTFSIVNAQEKDFGFTGEFTQRTLEVFPPFLYQQGFEVEDEEDSVITIQAKKKVKALMIGITNLAKPDNPEWELFDFYSYHWPGYHDWWLGFIVVNYDNVTVPCKIKMQIKGPKKDTIKRDAVLQPNEATIFSAKVNLADKVGIYTLIGTIVGKDIAAGKKVSTRFYVYEIWD